MKSLLLAASVFAVVSATMPSARAADLGYDRSPADNYSSPYDDPRYRDLYSAPPPRYAERYEYRERTYREPVPGYAYRDDRYLAPDRFAEDYRPRPGCLPRYEIRQGLAREGWHDFQALELRPDIALLRARRPNGALFDLKVDRCSGAVVDAHPIGGYVPGPYAYGPRRWDRPYF
jgi:hypothetical protein